MSKIELTIAPNYVPNWTYVDAVRELFQNALDQATQNPDNVASWNYDSQTGILTISNATSKLTASSLLLGQTTKSGDSDTIGQFGEGYKIATLVLLREGKNVVFYNYGAREIWRPRFVKSRRFGTDILTFFIEKQAIWDKVPSADLVIAVDGISVEEYGDIVESNLHLRDDYEVVEHTEYGNIIDLPGKVFVNGLFVCDYEPYAYGYDFKPAHIRLDRDRKMVNDFDLRWMASKMWSGCEDTDKVMQLIVDDKADVAFIDSVSYTSSWRDLAADKFKSVYGPEAIPVSNQEELDEVPTGYKGIVVSESYCSLVRKSSSFIMPAPDEHSPIDDLQDWYDSIKHKLDSDEQEQFEAIMDDLCS